MDKRLRQAMLTGLLDDFEIQLMESVLALKDGRDARLRVPTPICFGREQVIIRPGSALVVDCGPSEMAAVVRINIDEESE